VRAYFIRRLLLIPFTLLGVTFIVFALTRFLPGGPLEQRMQNAMMAQEGKSAGKSMAATSVLNDDQLIALKRSFLMDKDLVSAFLMWWGILPSEVLHCDAKNIPVPEPGKMATKEIFLPLRGADGNMVSQKALISLDSGRKLQLHLAGPPGADGQPTQLPAPTGWEVRREVPSAEQKALKEGKPVDPPKQINAVAFRKKFHGVLQWEFRNSLRFGDPVWSMIKERFPISIFYGVLSLILTYGVCIPLGIVKAIKHRTWIDSLSSVGIFAGYAIPGFALGSVLLLLFCFRIEWFPMGGFVSENFQSLSLWGKVKDLMLHAALPLLCYLVGQFAFTTMLMKNNLMDNLAADYVRTAIAKGAMFKRAVVGHALRNSLIPIATTFGQNVTLLVTGSMLIESVFDIYGFGKLGLNALQDRDYTISLAMIFLSALLMMIGNVLSDFLVALLNPRIRFE
jgi:microcin C transport system permease protein